MGQNVEAIKITTKLSGNPNGEPKFSIKTKLKNGKELTLADPKATRAMVALMDMSAVIGGAASHYGGPAAFAEIMAALYGYAFHEAKEKQKQWSELFHIINDAGHCENGLYALHANYGRAHLSIESLKKFRSIESVLTGHGEAPLFPQAVYLSNGPLGSSVSQAQGLACAEKISGGLRVTVSVMSDGAAMEGESKEAFASIPGLAAKGKLAPFVMVMSDNNTKLSGRIDQQSFSMIPTFEAMSTLGWQVIKVNDGHNLTACLHAFEEAVEMARNNPLKPVFIWAKTIKGYGTKQTSESASGGHGFPLKSAQQVRAFVEEIWGNSSLPSEFSTWIEELIDWEKRKSAESKVPKLPKEKVQAGLSRAMINKRKDGFPIVSICSDVPGSTGVEAFRKEFPESSFDVGVAEANMISMAVGMSKQGFIPVVDTFAQFGVTKGALPLIMSSLSEAPIIGVFSHTGFQDAADGASHQALSYFAMTHAIPHVETYCLTSSDEAEWLMGLAIGRMAQQRKDGVKANSVLFFLGREDYAKGYYEDLYELGKAQIIFDTSSEFPKNKSVTIVAAGPLLPQALKAANELRDRNVGAIVINPSAINQPDLETIQMALEKTWGNLITVEDHQIIGGMGSVLVHALVQNGVHLRLRSLGVNKHFGRSSYTSLELYQAHGMDAVAIEKAAIELTQKNRGN